MLRMEGKQSQVVLIGTWASGYCKRVELALKLKGIPYEYIEEDLENKSSLLRHSNPVHKKVPVLLHDGIPIAESLVILEYIDEYWSNVAPKLLPEDPYQRAKIRFWANYHDQKIMPAILRIALSQGEERDQAIEDHHELLKVFEEGIEKDFPAKSPFLNGDSLGFLDVIVGTVACNYQAFHEVVTVIFEPAKHPSFFSWVTALKEHPLIKDVLPPHDKLVALMRKKYCQSPKA
ncbi:glutathione S-transferase U10-like [Herrania umbratica]|uniref:Glutathione S-transferase n=1 Tax=Herrania umbratica TaxID=108875 RepID=A0A6J1BK46_9ROSI|nr:glutathione S-transferase U10-like [Herrania umbratica]